MNAQVASLSIGGTDWMNQSTTETTDLELLEQVQHRNKFALEMLYDRYSARGLGLAYKILKDRDLAEEVTQEAFWRVWERAAQFQMGRGTFSSWFLGIVRNLAIDEVRRREARPSTEEDEALEQHLSQNPDSQMDLVQIVSDHLQSESIRKALEALPRAQREVIELSYFEGLTREEIARHLGEPLGTIHTRARLGLNKLREVFSVGRSEVEWNVQT